MESPTIDAPAAIFDINAITSTLQVEDNAEQYRVCTPEIRTHADGKKVTVKIMSGEVARDGMIVEPAGLNVRNYEPNPVILWNHGFSSHGTIPIGTASNLRINAAGTDWLADASFDPDEFSQMIGNKVRGGSIRAVSIGWITHAAENRVIDGQNVRVITNAELTEFSFVAVGADPRALVQQRNLAGINAAIRNAISTDPLIMELRARLEELETLRQGATAPIVETLVDPAPATAAPALPVPATPIMRSATTEEYTQLIRQLLPTIVRAVDNAIDIKTGRL